MFMGEYHHNLDSKGRVVMPSKFREKLQNEFVIARGIEKCLYVYTLEDWNKLVQKLNTLSFTKKDTRIFIRAFFSGATTCETDMQGRTTIPSSLISYASINKEITIIGASDHIEIWDKDMFDTFLMENEDNLSNIAENLFGGDI